MMKTQKFLPAIIFIVSLHACEKDGLDSELNGVTFTKFETYSPPEVKLNGNIASYSELLGYDSSNYTFLLSDEACNKIKKVDYPVYPTPFAIALDGQLIYVANFIPGYSSLSCEDCISIEPYSHDNKYTVNLGYPGGSNLFSGEDPRNDARIISRLSKDNKLINIDL